MATQTDTTILYSFRRCPYAIRARLALWYSDVSFELREVVLKNKPQALIDASAKATVPVLIKSDGVVVDESIDIMSWAFEQAGLGDWSMLLKNSPLVEHNDGNFKHYLDRYKYFDRYPEQSQQYYFENACHFIAELESELSYGHFWLNGDSQSSLDMAIFPFVRQFAFVDKVVFDGLPFPSVQKWLARLLDSALFQTVMLKYLPWQNDQAPVLINH